MAIKWGQAGLAKSPALQPQRIRLVAPVLFLKAQSNGTVKFAAKVFADSLPEPLSLEVQVDVVVTHRKVKVRDLVKNAEDSEVDQKPPNQALEPTVRK